MKHHFKKAKKNWVGFHADYALKARAGHGGGHHEDPKDMSFWLK